MGAAPGPGPHGPKSSRGPVVRKKRVFYVVMVHPFVAIQAFLPPVLRTAAEIYFRAAGAGRLGEFPSHPGDTPDSLRQNLLARLLPCTVAQVVLLMLQCTVTVMPEFSWRHTMCGSHLYAMMMVCAHALHFL